MSRGNRVDDAALLADQVAYYRARAGEYDEWWARTGRYDRGAELNSAWRADCAAVEDALAAFLREHRPRRVLELACGTGLFTRQLAPAAARLVAVDAAPEVIAINRMRTAAPQVEYVAADIFAWRSNERFDLVFFSFWLSHVPPARFDAFWAQVRNQLAPGGVAWLIDSAFDRTSTANDHVLSDAGVLTRKLNDGREFRVVKVFHEPGELNERLVRLGWEAGIARTARYFIHGPARPV
jgi:demethylmenaquinone methyltransferase/2-methoxy-6-polyprenyl-1,4-benzoquinol methylase